MEINIDNNLLPTLVKIAGDNKLTPEVYASGIVATFLESQFRGAINDKVKNKTISELKELDVILTIPKK